MVANTSSMITEFKNEAELSSVGHVNPVDTSSGGWIYLKMRFNEICGDLTFDLIFNLQIVVEIGPTRYDVL